MKKIIIFLICLFIGIIGVNAITEEQFLAQDFSDNVSLNTLFQPVSYNCTIKTITNYVMIINRTYLECNLEIRDINSKTYELYRINITYQIEKKVIVKDYFLKYGLGYEFYLRQNIIQHYKDYLIQRRIELRNRQTEIIENNIENNLNNLDFDMT